MMGIVGDGPCAVPHCLTEYPYVEIVFNHKEAVPYASQPIVCFAPLCYIEHLDESFLNRREDLTQLKHGTNRITHAGLPSASQGMKMISPVVLFLPFVSGRISEEGMRVG